MNPPWRWPPAWPSAGTILQAQSGSQANSSSFMNVSNKSQKNIMVGKCLRHLQGGGGGCWCVCVGGGGRTLPDQCGSQTCSSSTYKFMRHVISMNQNTKQNMPNPSCGYRTWYICVCVRIRLFKVIRKFILKHNKSFRWHLGDYEKHNFFLRIFSWLYFFFFIFTNFARVFPLKSFKITT